MITTLRNGNRNGPGLPRTRGHRKKGPLSTSRRQSILETRPAPQIKPGLASGSPSVYPSRLLSPPRHLRGATQSFALFCITRSFPFTRPRNHVLVCSFLAPDRVVCQVHRRPTLTALTVRTGGTASSQRDGSFGFELRFESGFKCRY